MRRTKNIVTVIKFLNSLRMNEWIEEFKPEGFIALNLLDTMGIVRRRLMPEVNVVIDFHKVTMNEFKKSSDVYIKLDGEFSFYYNKLFEVFERYFKKSPFLLRLIEYNGSCYLELTLDSEYSLLYISCYVWDEEDIIEIFGSMNEWYRSEEKINYKDWDEVFQELKISSDMIL